MLSFVTADGEPVVVKVKVGQAVDTTGQSNRAKRIAGFSTHKSPVLLAYGDRAEFATDEYIALSPVLEGVVVVKKNPNYKPEE